MTDTILINEESISVIVNADDTITLTLANTGPQGPPGLCPFDGLFVYDGTISLPTFITYAEYMSNGQVGYWGYIDLTQ